MLSRAHRAGLCPPDAEGARPSARLGGCRCGPCPSQGQHTEASCSRQPGPGTKGRPQQQPRGALPTSGGLPVAAVTTTTTSAAQSSAAGRAASERVHRAVSPAVQFCTTSTQGLATDPGRAHACREAHAGWRAATHLQLLLCDKRDQVSLGRWGAPQSRGLGVRPAVPHSTSHWPGAHGHSVLLQAGRPWRWFRTRRV